MENPFESGHIKNYLLLYASVVVIMILFFIASSLFNDIEKVEKKEFATELPTATEIKKVNIEKKREDSPFKLLDKAY